EGLWPYENVTVRYGHIHREHAREDSRARHLAAAQALFPRGPGERAATQVKRTSEAPLGRLDASLGLTPPFNAPEPGLFSRARPMVRSA
ncbi:MAG: hypothetical protein ACJ79E_18510, partial [Anaeromyxobacteraceae bacterium]